MEIALHVPCLAIVVERDEAVDGLFRPLLASIMAPVSFFLSAMIASLARDDCGTRANDRADEL